MVQEAGARIPISDEEARAHLAAIIDSTDDAILSKTREGIVTSWNRGAERLYGYLAEEAIGRPISFLVPPERLDELQQITDTILRGERVDRLETERISKDGRRIMVSLTLSPILAPDGSIIGVSTIARDITEQKLMERSLRESERRYRTLVEMAPEAVVVHQDGKLVYANCAALGIFGARTLDQLQQTSLLDLVHPDDRETVRERIRQLLDGEEIPLREYRLRGLNGQEISVEASSTLIDYHGRPSIQIIARDITERKRAEQERESLEKALRRSEQRFRLMTDSMPQIAWTANPDGSIDYINAHFELYTGIQRDATQILDNLAHPERLILALVHPDDAEPTANAWLSAVHTGEIYQYETRIRRADGAYHWHLSRAIPERDEQGAVVKWYGTATDVNDLREMQEKLRASETKFRRLYESNLIAIFFWNKDGRITEANQAFCDLVGYSEAECKSVQLSWLDATPPELFARDFAAIEEVMQRGICKPYEKAFVNRLDGHRVSVLTAVARMAGTEAEGIAFAVDLTELKRAEQALKTSEATLKLAVEITGLGIFDLDLRSKKGNWSDIAKRHYGLPPEAEADLSVLMSGVHPEDRERIEKIARDATRSGGAGVYSAEYRTVGLGDGELRWLTMRARQLLDEQGEPARLVGACIDITDFVKAEKALKDEITERLRAVEELRKQEQLLIRQARLAAMGEMIGNIAHQWRQPLNTLGLIVQELPKYYERNLFSKDYLEASVTRAMQVINYMSKTIDGFRNFFGPDKEKEEFNASEVLAKTVSIVEAAFNQLNLRIEVNADQDAVIYGCPNEFSQVILNILMNAKDALMERNIQQPRVVVRLFRENERLVLTIADNAGGIEQQIMDKIFDPYFTTKGPDKGTGIGLFMSKTIIEKNMNGTLTVHNTEEGAEFRIEV